jgi:hypothetical protein
VVPSLVRPRLQTHCWAASNVKSISTSLGMGLLQTQEIIATSIADAIIAEAQVWTDLAVPLVSRLLVVA